MTVHGLVTPLAGFLAGVLVNYALWRGSPDPSNLAIWRGAVDPPTDPSSVRTLALVALLAVLIVGGLLLALGVRAVVGVPTLPLVLAVAAAAFVAVAAVDYREGRPRSAAFYLVAALLWVAVLANRLVDPATAGGRAAVSGLTFAVLGYFVMDVLDVGLPDRTGAE